MKKARFKERFDSSLTFLAFQAMQDVLHAAYYEHSSSEGEKWEKKESSRADSLVAMAGCYYLSST